MRRIGNTRVVRNLPFHFGRTRTQRALTMNPRVECQKNQRFIECTSDNSGEAQGSNWVTLPRQQGAMHAAPDELAGCGTLLSRVRVEVFE